jgi:L-aspartate oxidase
MECDVLIAGSGIAGLFTALNLREDLKIILLSNADLNNCSTYHAQGGITTILDEADKKSFFEDTMTAGGYLNNPEIVKLVANEAEDCIKTLVDIGVDFTRNSDGSFKYTREAAHSKNRILYCADQTGKEIFLKLLDAVKAKKNVEIIDNAELFDLKVYKNRTSGAHFFKEDKVYEINSNYVVLCTGGIGGLFKNSTNERNLKGIGLALSLRYNIELRDINFIQIHPTAFYEKVEGKRLLISESLRGEGAILLDKDGKRFIDELLPRDVVSNAISERNKKLRCENVYLDISHLDKEYLMKRFPYIYKNCLKKGVDITKERIPVTPCQHYFVGGIAVDENGKTSMDALFAAGEVACTGLHGRNRLASNSLLEAVVFGKRVSKNINSSFKKLNVFRTQEHPYMDAEAKKLIMENWKIAAGEILKVREDLKSELLDY